MTSRRIREIEAAQDLGASISALQKGRQGKGAFASLPYEKYGRAVRYDTAAIERWRQERVKAHGGRS